MNQVSKLRRELEANTAKLAKEIVNRRKADAALQESDRKFREIVQNIPGVVFQIRIHPDGTNQFTYLSPKAYEIFGITSRFADPEWDISPYLHPDDRAGFFLSLAKATLGDSWDYTGRIITKTDELKWFHGIASSNQVGEDKIIDGLLMDITEKKLIEDAQSFLIESDWTYTGEDFFQSLARFLAKTLEMDYVCIDRLTEGELMAETVAIYFDGHFEDNVSYTLMETPCGSAVGKTICCYPEKVCQIFPNDVVLCEMVAESYVATTLWSTSRKVIGLIAVIGRHSLRNPEFAESVLKMVSIRAAAEMERRVDKEKISSGK